LPPVGYIDAWQEMWDQDVPGEIDDIVLACGSGGTVSGLALANLLTGMCVCACSSGGTVAGLALANLLTGRICQYDHFCLCRI
jgi:1-aminocyclopropane-1-carboxylate deaminase/D-cysteine desulfhydrase-like pyridoxal-dependent ACC family enzyme